MSEQVHGLGETQDPNLTSQERHLLGIGAVQIQKPWFLTFFTDLKEYFFPPKLPPLQITSKPLSQNEIGAGSFIYSPSTDIVESDVGKRLELLHPGIKIDSDHLERLAHTGQDMPGYAAFYYNLKDYFFPPKQQPLKVTSKPVQVKDIWGFTGGYKRNAVFISALFHVGVVAFLFLAVSTMIVEEEVKTTINLIAPDVNISTYLPKPKPKQMGGGGGGGDNSPIPPSKGQLPKLALKQFVPPAAVVNNPSPKLIMQPTIVVPPDIMLPEVDINAWGDPLANAGPPSNGPGSRGGIGTGDGGGVGSGSGAGFGPGEGGGFGGGVYRIGGGVTQPTVIFQVEPEYSEEARKAKFQGTVVLYVIIDEKGLPRQLKVVRALGLGLDEKAMEAVKRWRFRPGYLNGKAVAVEATVEVNFRLL